MPFQSLHLDGHQRSQATRNQQTVGQLSLSSSGAIALPSLVSKSHSISCRMRSVRPPSNSQVDKSSLSHTLPISGSSAAGLFTPRSACSCFAVVFRCRTIACSCFMRFISSANSSSGTQRRQPVRLRTRLSSHFSDMSQGTVPLERQTFSVGETQERTPPRLFALFAVGTHALEGFPSVPSEVLDSLTRWRGAWSQRERGRTKGDLPPAFGWLRYCFPSHRT